MTWHAVDNQSTHVKPIYHGGPKLKVLVEVPTVTAKNKNEIDPIQLNELLLSLVE